MTEKPLVIVLAAGMGTRMKSDTPKVLHRVAGRELIVWSMEVAREVSAERTIAVLGHQHERVRDVLAARYDDGFEVALQLEQKGTGHAVQCALPTLESESSERIVIILSGDVPLLRALSVRDLIGACQASSSGVALMAMRPGFDSAYGRLVRDASGKLLRIVEYADANDEQRAIEEMNAGVYAVKLGVLRDALANLSSDNAQGEFYLTDLAETAAELDGAATTTVPFVEVSGINDRVDLARCEARARHEINEAWMRQGVTMIAPDQVFIDADAGPIAKDVIVGPGVCLRGKTSIGERTRIDTGAVLVDTTVASDVYIKPHSMLSETEVGSGAQIGPFAHCRPGTKLESDVKVGNFVETKKTHMGQGAKASHLTYLGDASVGAGANVGAGTITCNYDGFGKHKTVIEAGAFIGSNTELIAPVTVGRDAYVAAGSTVTKTVPRAGLALSRVKQVNVDGWAQRFRDAQAKRRAGKKTS